MYRKVRQETSGTTLNAWNTLFTDNTIDTLVNVQVWYEKMSSQYPAQNNSSFLFYWYDSSHFFQEKHTNDYWNSVPITLICEYTKTTD